MSNIVLNKGGILLKNADFSAVRMGKSAFIGYHTIMGPVGWDINAEPINIIEKFRASTIDRKMCIFAIPDEATTVDNNQPWTGVDTHFYETINGVEIVAVKARGTAWTPTPGSTHRYAIFAGVYKSNSVSLSGASWAHFGDVYGPIVRTTGAITNGKNFIAKITSDSISLTAINENFWPQGTGILYLPATMTELGYGFRTNNLQAVVSYATTPPTWGGTTGSYTISCDVFVPDDSVDAYKAASRWSANASRIRPLSEFNIANYQ